MAKKLTARQRKARKQASYVKAEYYKNVDAIRYLKRFGVTAQISIPNKITKASLKAIRRIYKETRRGIKTYEGSNEYVDITTGEVFTKIPTKAEAVREYRKEERGEIPRYDPDSQYIDELKNKINSLKPLRDSDKTEKNYNKNVVPKLEKAKSDFSQAIDKAIGEFGLAIVAETLAADKYMNRIEELENKYTYEIVEDISDGDDGLIMLMNTSAETALSRR